jgi:hypothetical protein
LMNSISFGDAHGSSRSSASDNNTNTGSARTGVTDSDVYNLIMQHLRARSDRHGTANPGENESQQGSFLPPTIPGNVDNNGVPFELGSNVPREQTLYSGLRNALGGADASNEVQLSEQLRQQYAYIQQLSHTDPWMFNEYSANTQWMDWL